MIIITVICNISCQTIRINQLQLLLPGGSLGPSMFSSFIYDNGETANSTITKARERDMPSF
jgi:hypothetical protein